VFERLAFEKYLNCLPTKNEQWAPLECMVNSSKRQPVQTTFRKDRKKKKRTTK
jgi:hypothetical protein